LFCIYKSLYEYCVRLRRTERFLGEMYCISLCRVSDETRRKAKCIIKINEISTDETTSDNNCANDNHQIDPIITFEEIKTDCLDNIT